MTIRPHSARPAALAALLALLPLTSGTAAMPLPAGPIAPPPTTQLQKSMLLEMQDAFTKIADTVEPSVVNIKSERLRPNDGVGGGSEPPAPKSGPKGHRPLPLPGLPSGPLRSEATGSGVIVRPDGYILTNDHVVDGASGGTVLVTLADGREFRGRVYPDFRSDLAVVKIDAGPTPLPAATFADSSAVKPGQWAIAIGSPFDLQNTMTVGVISATGRHQTIGAESPSGGRYYPDLLQTDAAINPGNSGGPLFNIDGQVVGINVAIESPVEGSAGVGFAIPSDIAQQIMASLISQGKVVRGQLGVVPDDLTPSLQALYGQKTGAFLRDVSLSDPAGKAGLQAADIITSFDGRPITDEVSLRLAIAATPPSRTVTIGYVRDGVSATTTATIGAPTAAPEDAPVTATPVPALIGPKLGLTVRDLNATDRKRLNVSATTTGAFITGLAPGSPAEMAGLGAAGVVGNGIVERVDRTPVNSKAEFDRAVAALPAGAVATLVVLYPEADSLHPQSNPLHQSAFIVRL